MTPEDLRLLPPEGTAQLAPLPRALWHDAQGNWTAAHQAAADIDTPQGSWVHAYLHRREGDNANAAYWYRRAGKPVAAGPLDEEWAEIASAVLRG